MANVLTPITRALNQEFSGRGFRCQVSIVGSFVAVRIEDPDHKVTLWDAECVRAAAADLFAKAGIITDYKCYGFGHVMHGVVMNWSRA